MMELTEILISILHDDQIEKVFFVIDGLDYSLQQCQSQFHYFLGLLNALSLKNTKICLTHHSKLDVSSLKQVIHLDIGQKLHRAHWASENAIDRIRSNLRDEIYRNDSTSVMMELQEVFQVISERKGQSFLPEILLRRALGSLRQSHYLREFVQFMHKWSETEVHNETLQINDIYSWILPRIHSATQNELTLTQLLFLVSLAARPLTVNEAIELLPRPKLDQTSSALYENLPPNDLRMNIEPDQIEDDTFGLLRLDNGIITICHPSLKVFIVAYLERSHLKSFMEYQIGISCLRLLNHLRKSTAVGDTTYDWGRRAHSVSVDLYSYAFKYWSRHLVASHSASKWKPADSEPILSALKDLWTDESMRCLMHEFSRANFPRNSSFPLSCLLAGYNLWSVLEAWFYSEPSKKALDYLSLEEKCAAANSAEGSLKILQKHGYDSTFPDNKERTVEDYKRWVASENIKENFFLPDWAYNSLGEDQQDGRRDEKAIWSDFYESIKNNSSGPIEQLKSKGLLQQSLALSVRRCDIQLARQLLRHGANPNYVDKDDPQLPSILHLAAATGDFKLVKRLLVFGCRSSVTDRLGMRPIHWAAERGHFQVVQLLVSPSADLDDKFGRNPLFMACESTSAQTVRVLLKFGSNINLQDKAGRTPLHAAASTGALDMVRLLLSRGASPGAQDRKGICPLHVGAYGGWVGVVEELLAWGVPVDVPSKSKQTALHFACKSLNPSLEVVSTLLQQQSNPNAQDSKGHTPLQIAVRGGSYAIVDILLKATDCDPRSPELRVFARGNASLLDLLQEHISDQPAGSMLNAEPSGNPADGPLVNVVFVHGFHRTQWETWSNSQTFWPMDYLRTDMANARIICWDHRYESADFSSFDNVQRLARKLLEYVIDSASSSNSNTSAERPIRSSRWFASPLVFVGHSLGGLIIKLALDIAAKDDDFASINVNIKGVVLLGTPHYVPDEDLYLNVFSQLVLSATSQRLAPLFWRPPRPLNKDGPWFAHDIHKHESLEKDFTRICMLKEISVLSIMEEGSSRGGEQVVLYRFPNSETYY
jgi:ankyrin repeat protein